MSEEDKEWLDRQARRENTTMTQVVRRAIHEYRRKAAGMKSISLDDVLKRTRGTWKGENGLAYQRKMRGEWDSGR